MLSLRYLLLEATWNVESPKRGQVQTCSDGSGDSIYVNQIPVMPTLLLRTYI